MEVAAAISGWLIIAQILDFLLNIFLTLNFISGPKPLTCACAGLVFGIWCVFNISQNIHYMSNLARGPAPTRTHNLS
ncbi:hypothetical protein C8R43DRAFT_1035651, partial [Mycena crocata]